RPSLAPPPPANRSTIISPARSADCWGAGKAQARWGRVPSAIAVTRAWRRRRDGATVTHAHLRLPVGNGIALANHLGPIVVPRLPRALRDAVKAILEDRLPLLLIGLVFRLSRGAARDGDDERQGD